MCCDPVARRHPAGPTMESMPATEVRIVPPPPARPPRRGMPAANLCPPPQTVLKYVLPRLPSTSQRGSFFAFSPMMSLPLPPSNPCAPQATQSGHTTARQDAIALSALRKDYADAPVHICAVCEVSDALAVLSQDTLPSPLPIGSLSQYYYSHCTTSDVYGTPVTNTVNTAVTIAFSNSVPC